MMKRVVLFFCVLIALCLGGYAINCQEQVPSEGALHEAAAQTELLKEHMISQGEGNSYRLLKRIDEAEPILEMATSQDSTLIYVDDMAADVSSTMNFKLQFLSTQGTGRFIIDGIDDQGNTVAGMGWVLSGDLPESTAMMKWIDSRYSINFVGSWIDTYYNVKVMLDKEIGNVDYSKIVKFRFRVEAGDGQHVLIARRDLFDDHSKSLQMMAPQSLYQVQKGDTVTIQASLGNRSKQVIDSAGVELVLPYGYGILPIDSMVRVVENLQPGEERLLTWQVKANRADLVNLKKPWQVLFNVNGVIDEKVPIEISVTDKAAGKIYYVMTEDLEPSDSAGYLSAWGNQDGWINPEELTVQMVEKAEKMNKIADRYGAKWTHYIALPVLKAAQWAEAQAPDQGWAEALTEIGDSMRSQSALGHAYALHLHMDYDPDLAGNVVSYNKEYNGIWGNHLLHGWANLLPEEGSYQDTQSRIGSLYAYQRMLEESVGQAAFGQSLTARAGSFDFGDGKISEEISTRAYQKVGYFASSDADGNIQGYTSADYGKEIYFATAADINRETTDLSDIGLVEFRLTPREFIAYEKGTDLDWNKKVDQGVRYFVENGRIAPGVHAIVGFTHAFFMMGDGDWRSLEGGKFGFLERHLDYVQQQYVKTNWLNFATADELIAAYLDYYTPKPLAIYGRLLDENLLNSHYEIKILGKDIPASETAPFTVQVKYPLILRDTAYKIIVLKNGQPIKVQDMLPTENNEIEFAVDDRQATYSMRIFHHKLLYDFIHCLDSLAS